MSQRVVRNTRNFRKDLTTQIHRLEEGDTLIVECPKLYEDSIRTLVAQEVESVHGRNFYYFLDIR